MKIADMEACASQVSLEKKHLVLASFLACVLDIPSAAALTFNEVAPEELPAIKSGSSLRMLIYKGRDIMKIADMEACASQVSLEKKHLVLASFLACVLDMPNAAALTFNKAAPDDSHATDHRWFSGENSTEKSAAGQSADEGKPVWSLQVGHMSFMGRSNGTDAGKLPLILFESGSQMILRREEERIAVRVEWRF